MFRKKNKDKDEDNEEKDLFNFNKVLYKDIIAPSCVKEIAPGDITAAGKAESYWVEIGDRKDTRCKADYRYPNNHDPDTSVVH
jgi:hypothetical protein